MDAVAHGEMLEKELDALIRRRGDKTPDPDEIEPGYIESVKRYNAQRRQANRWEWIRFFDRMAASHTALAASYEERAQALLEGRGEGGRR